MNEEQNNQFETNLEERRKKALELFIESTDLKQFPEDIQVLQERAFLVGYSYGHNDLVDALDEEVEKKKEN